MDQRLPALVLLLSRIASSAVKCPIPEILIYSYRCRPLVGRSCAVASECVIFCLYKVKVSYLFILFIDMEVGIFSPRSKSKNRIKCVMRGCESRANKNLNLRFHCFPKSNVLGNLENMNHLKAWKLAIKICGVTPTMKLCSVSLLV